ncbi:MAG TPA: hypothetical protein VFE20_04095 [Thermoleophilia bacterium]|nr:hypothetical protein [Thermoleophilia bacterium]
MAKRINEQPTGGGPLGWWRRRDEMQKVLILVVLVIGGWLLWQSGVLPGIGSDDGANSVADGEATSDAEDVPTTELQPFEAYQDQSEEVDYQELKAKAEDYRGRMITFVGEVVQVERDLGLTVMKVAITRLAEGFDPDDTVLVGYGGEEELVEGDVVTVWGDGLGTLELPEDDQAEELPSVLAKYIEIGESS